VSGADHPRERVFVVREPPQPDGIEPLRVLQRTDGKFIVYDERLPPGRRARTERDSLDQVVADARAIAAGATPLFVKRDGGLT
jgi:hypothetical protein